MAYRKLLTKRTHDEMEELNSLCQKAGNENGIYDFVSVLQVGGDVKDGSGEWYVIYVVERKKINTPVIQILYGKTFEETKSMINAFLLGVKSTE